MTKSRGIGRGGLRSNPGGRPKKVRPEPIRQASAVIGQDAKLDLEALVEKAYRVLECVLDNPTSTVAVAPVVAAARVIVTTAGPAAGIAAGKKEQRAEAAKSASVGRFATPAPPPRLVVDNR